MYISTVYTYVHAVLLAVEAEGNTELEDASRLLSLPVDPRIQSAEIVTHHFPGILLVQKVVEQPFLALNQQQHIR